MPTEIERKFLVKSEAWREGLPGERIVQGYLCREKERTVRVRIKGDKGFLTIKGLSEGVSRKEFEYEIPVGEADELLLLCTPPLLDKVRYERRHGGHLWEIDEFAGENHGLIVAEIELDEEGSEFEKPEWVGEEVSDDPRYYNACLVEHPWSQWRKR
ncbi:CYTH domain-containing protein [Luteolibacter luteus]|uniref:CYTH domain-containing protein n=1 Tax=Luteolibacter luteus TaxID=2728835 RepID=A0A858RE87_9BACT|nr:CYTH domain-containing protein [Luteolibacter luteus]QJE94874.1 CYTH domain-containing protein [Luteolibacter luteus]